MPRSQPWLPGLAVVGLPAPGTRGEKSWPSDECFSLVPDATLTGGPPVINLPAPEAGTCPAPHPRAGGCWAARGLSLPESPSGPPSSWTREQGRPSLKATLGGAT